MLSKNDLRLLMDIIKNNCFMANTYERHLQNYYKALYSGVPDYFLEASMICEQDLKRFKGGKYIKKR